MTTTTAQALTELVLTGSRAEIAILADAARRSGRLVHTIGPRPVGGHDPRHRIRLFLQPTT